MRCVAGAGLVLLGACNQIFGISQTQPWDARVVPPHAELTWQVATTSSTGGPGPIELPAFTPPIVPTVKISPNGPSFVDAEYLTSPGMEGWIRIPDSYPGTAWRLTYQLPAGVLHEVQWNPTGTGHLTMPVAGRLDRAPVPTDSGYAIAVTSPPASYANLRVVTTGLWTSGVAPVPAIGAPVNYDFASAITLSGDKGRPDPARGDRGLLLDVAIDPTSKCAYAQGAAPLGDVSLAPGARTTQTVAWDATRKPVTSESVSLTFTGRLNNGLGTLRTTLEATRSMQLFGVVPSTVFPGLTAASPGLQLPSPDVPAPVLPAPVLQILEQCPYNATLLPTAQPAQLGAFMQILHVQLVEGRQVLGATLYSGIETVLASPGDAGFKVSFPAAIPTKVTLATPSGSTLDLVDGPDQAPVASGGGTFTLAFVPEAGFRADYHEVRLHRIVSGQPITERIYLVTAPEVRIDSTLQASSDYVFEIRSYAGHPGVSSGDFAAVEYPYGAAIVFTRTIRTGP